MTRLSYAFPLQHSDVTIQEANKHWKQAKRELKKCQQNARAFRHQSYEHLLERYENDPNPDNLRKKKIVENTIRTENCCETFRQIKLASKPFQEYTGGLKSIQRIPRRVDPSHNTHACPSTTAPDDIYTHLIRHPDGPIEWETVIDRSEIERHLLSYNKSSFRAASTSPCGHGVIMDALTTFSTISTAGTEVLQGIIPDKWHNNNQLLKEFLLSFSIPENIANSAPIKTTISEDDDRKVLGNGKRLHPHPPPAGTWGTTKPLFKIPSF